MPTHTSSSTSKSSSASRNKPAPPRSSRAASSVTDERDEVYGLVSVIYHALQGAQTYAMYIQDAHAAGDQELVEFFEECRDEESDRAERAKALLAMRIEGQDEADSNGEDEEEDDEDVEEES